MRALIRAYQNARFETKLEKAQQKRYKLRAKRDKLREAALKAKEEHEALLAQKAAQDRGQVIRPKSIVAKASAGKIQ